MLAQFIDGSHVPVIVQRRCTVKVPQIQLSPVTVDIPVVQQRRGLDLGVMAAMKGFMGVGGAFSEVLTPFFALLRLSGR